MVPFRKGSRGFTAIEIVAVLIILGVLTAVVVAKISSTSSYELRSQVDVVKNHLRYSQLMAMSSSDEWGIHFNASTTYYLFHGVGSTTPVLLPGENSAIVNLVSKKSGLTINSAPQRITFDEFGSPGTTTVTITTNANPSTIIVTRNTGFIP